MPRIRTLFLLLTLIGPLHMIEQMLTSVEEYQAIRSSLFGLYSRFDASAADTLSVAIITIVWTVCSFLAYSLLCDGRARLIVPGLLGVFAVGELHHIVQGLQKGGYDAGILTCVPYAWVGALLVAAVWRELKQGRPAAATLRNNPAAFPSYTEP
jgi:hypothetical protein